MLIKHAMCKFLTLSSVALIFLVNTASVAASADLGQEEQTCNDVQTLADGEDRCAFVTAHCSAEGMINYLTIYYCHIQHWGVIPSFFMVAISAAMLIVLFRIIGRTADEYFSAILSQISQEMGLPPRLGGVTLLALGNGAPDLSSTIAAVRTGDYKLALGALTGAAMFVGCIVAGRIITLSGGVKARPAQIRDVLSQLIVILVVTGIVASGKFTYASVATLLSIYVLYVIIVAVADFTKRAGVEWTEVGADFSKKITASFRKRGGLATPLLNEDGPLLSSNNGGIDSEGEINGISQPSTPSEALVVDGQSPKVLQQQQNGSQRSMTNNDRNLSNGSGSSSVELSALEAGGTNTPRNTTSSSRNTNNSNNATQRADSAPLPVSTSRMNTTTSTQGAAGQTRRVATVSILPDIDTLTTAGSGGSNDTTSQHYMSAREYRNRALAELASSRSFYHKRPRQHIDDGGNNIPEERDEYASEEDEERYSDVEGGRQYEPPLVRAADDGDRLRSIENVDHRAIGADLEEDAEALTGLNKEMIQKTGQYLDLAAHPIMVLLRSTIPIVEESAYERQWFLISSGLAPLFIVFYLGAWHWQTVLGAIAAGIIGTGIAILGTKNLGEQPPLWSLGTSFPIGAAVVALYGFAVAAMWIDILASEIVGVLHFLGVLAAIDPAILGITVLAWGNSLMDYVSNTSMALKSAGGTSMAMTACYAGPLFNMLVGLGIGFWTLLVDSGQRSAAVSFDPVVIVGCVFIMANCVGISAMALRRRHWLNEGCGWAMMGWYGVYLVVVLVVLLGT